MSGSQKQRGRNREKGTILYVAVFLTLIVLLFIGQAVSTTLVEGQGSRYGLHHARALAIAEGITEIAQKNMLDAVASFEEPPLSGTVTLDGVDYDYTATPVGGEIQRTENDGVTLVIQPYELTAEVTSGEAVVTVNRIVDLTMTPIYQYMIFFDDDLEILPGPSMTLEGRVHSNSSIYIGAGATLTVDTEYMRCTGQILRERKNNGTQTGGTINVKVTGEDTFVNMTNSMDADHPDWINLALDTWGGTVQDGAHGVTEVASPEIGTIEAFAPDGSKGHYHANADLVIRDGQAFDSNDDPISLPPGTITETSFYDGREGQYVTVTDINVELLNTSGAFPANGLVYAYRTDASTSQPNGVRLSNGAELGGPLTVVTQNPLYVQGDYNTVNKQPSAVLCDAVNLLSNAWDDSKTSGSLPSASETQYNMAIVTGNIPTPDGGGNYSGGFENLPRFHENWSGTAAIIRGAFIKLYESQFAVSPWSYGGDVYTAPQRDWRFDPDFQSAAGMPPFTPNAVYVRRVTWDDNVPLPLPTGPTP